MNAIVIGHVVSALVSVAMLLVAWRWPPASRILSAVLCLVAGIFNGVTAVRTPQVYIEGFAPRSLPPMREFVRIGLPAFID